MVIDVECYKCNNGIFRMMTTKRKYKCSNCDFEINNKEYNEFLAEN